MTTVTQRKQGLDLANSLEGFLAAFALPCLHSGGHVPTQLLLAVERDGMVPSGLDGGRVCLWFGELVAFMRDRTLDEGNDLSQALLVQLGGERVRVKVENDGFHERRGGAHVATL